MTCVKMETSTHMASRLALNVTDPRGHHPPRRVLAPPTATISALVLRLRGQWPDFCHLLDGAGLALLPPALTLRDALASGAIALAADPAGDGATATGGGRCRIVGSFGQPIFVHIPKTGGTTMIAALRQQAWQPHHNDFHYRHIVYGTTQSTSGDLFNDAATLAALSGTGAGTGTGTGTKAGTGTGTGDAGSAEESAEGSAEVEDIEEEEEEEGREAQTVFTILREPLERAISEYAFLRDRPHFMDRLEVRRERERESERWGERATL